MASLNKVRVQLLDTSSGSVLQEVDVLTSADAVTFADGQTFQQKLDSGALKGATGPQGVQGPAGDPFTIAKTCSSISAMNSGYSTDGVKQGQFVVIDTGNVNDTDNAKLYIKGNTAYTYLTDLSGAQGIQGPQGIQGIQGPKGDTGATGATGSVGATGAKGADGATWLLGSGAPTTQGKTGDFYLNTSNFDVYSKATGSWVLTGNIKGATGATGSQGPAGADGASVKFGTTYATGTDVKLFLKTM